MHKIILAGLLSVGMQAFAQEDLSRFTDPIVAEGKRLYQSEMASWYGSDMFMADKSDKSNVGGYFSYPEGNAATCIFFSKGDVPMVLATIAFDSTYNTKSAQLVMKERELTPLEKQYYALRKKAKETVDSDSLFKFYKNTSLNLVPMISNGEKKVYVLTGPQQQGVVIFGNDYLMTFDENNHLLSKKQLHRNIIPIGYGGEDVKNVEATVHSHASETGDFITATDICTLMLFEKFAGWKQHNVVSEKYLNIWNCETDQLVVLPMKTVDKINKDQEKQQKKREKKK